MFQWRNTKKAGNCIVYLGATDRDGYAYYTGDGKTTRAHRAAYRECVGPIPAGMVLMHTCDNPACVSLQHLSPGTQAMNMRDMAAKGRRGRPNAKTTTEQAGVIVSRACAGERQADIGAEFGISQAAVSSLVKHAKKPQV